MSISSGLSIVKNLEESIDWDMTPEEAVRLYLEWGNNWSGGKYVIRSESDVVYYFVINTWKAAPIIYFIERSEKEASELAKINLPKTIAKEYFERNGTQKGVFALDENLKEWLKSEIKREKE